MVNSLHNEYLFNNKKCSFWDNLIAFTSKCLLTVTYIYQVYGHVFWGNMIEIFLLYILEHDGDLRLDGVSIIRI